jgi:Kef-type K+ transport system membrane component KefB/Trk K+ transport system NAD-binding subunit
MHLPQLIIDLAVILGVAAFVTYVFRLIRQPVVLGYIVAGVIVGPYTPPLFMVGDITSVQVWAELGVIFLMFCLGIEFSFRRLRRVGIGAILTALIQIIFMFGLGILVGPKFGWTGLNAAFLGCMIAISSTTIIIKALEELNLKSKKFAELVFGILIVEDLAAILMLVGLTSVVETDQANLLSMLWAGAKLISMVSLWLILGFQIVPRLMSEISKKGNNEMFVVVSLGLCLGMVTLSGYFHYSAALGAFVMGSILAETKEAHRIESLVSPLKDVFGAVFFVSVGMMLDLQVIVRNPLTIFGLSALIVIGKILAVSLGGLMTRQGAKTSLSAAFTMAQIGEFSFIIANLGLAFKVLEPEILPIIVAASVLTTFTTPYLIKVAPWMISRFVREAAKDHSIAASISEPVTNPWQGHVTIMQLHPNSSACGQSLLQLGIREKFAVNILSVRRGTEIYMAPSGGFVLFPYDQVQIFGEDDDLDSVREEFETKLPMPLASESNEPCQLVSFLVSPQCSLVGKTLQETRLGEGYGAMIVAIERKGQRTLNPMAHFALEAEDKVWIATNEERTSSLLPLFGI